MPFKLPEETFDYKEHAKNKILRANQLENTIMSQFKATYEDFWGVSGSDVTEETEDGPVVTFASNGSRYSVEEMQNIVENMPMSTCIDILGDAAALVQYIVDAYPEALESRYFTAAFDYTIDQTGLHFTNINEAWAKIEPATEE